MNNTRADDCTSAKLPAAPGRTLICKMNQVFGDIVEGRLWPSAQRETDETTTWLCAYDVLIFFFTGTCRLNTKGCIT